MLHWCLLFSFRRGLILQSFLRLCTTDPCKQSEGRWAQDLYGVEGTLLTSPRSCLLGTPASKSMRHCCMNKDTPYRQQLHWLHCKGETLHFPGHSHWHRASSGLWHLYCHICSQVSCCRLWVRKWRAAQRKSAHTFQQEKTKVLQLSSS